MKFHAGWIDRIGKLCKENPHVLITPEIPLRLHESKSIKKAAVLIPLCNRKGEASILYTLRSNQVGTHKGQVSFPGGHLDKDETAVDAAIREFYEELHAGRSNPAKGAVNNCNEPSDSPYCHYHTKDLQILGTCQTIPAITGTLVTPVIGFYHQDVDDLQCFSRNEQEVDAIFTRRIEDLISPSFVEYEILSRKEKSFRFPVFGAKTEYRIWGLTAIITGGVLENAIMPSMEE